MNDISEINKRNLIKKGIDISVTIIEVLDNTIREPFDTMPLRFSK
jgi:hypothetical protein